MFVSDHVAHALVELVSLHSMSNLVMGAASDKRYSRSANHLAIYENYVMFISIGNYFFT